MFAPSPRAPQQRLAGILAMLCRAVADRGGRKLLAGPLVILIWTRLHRLSGRITRLAARIEAGATPRKPSPRPPRPRRPRPSPPRLPGGKAWLARLMQQDGAAAASQLRYLLAEPDMAALAAADPRMGRLLRPLCHMLGVAPPPAIAQPRPVPSPRVPDAAAAPAPVPPQQPALPQAPTPPRREAPPPPPREHPAACGPPPAPA